MACVVSMDESAKIMTEEITSPFFDLTDLITVRVSIVTYFIDEDVIKLLDSFIVSASSLEKIKYSIVIVENGFKEKNDIHRYIEKNYKFCSVVITGSNLGYGKAHNSTLSNDVDYHLVLNPDVIFQPDTLKAAFDFMRSNQNCGLLSPQAFWRNGDRQYLCKRYPSVSTLFLRAFAPEKVRKLFRRKLERYCMVDETKREEVIWRPLIVTGCFMLFRNDVFLKLNGFDDSFFLYFEDTDLSLRAGKITDIAYVPQVKIIHHGGNVSRKGIRHIVFFTKSMFKFFNKHGWCYL